MPLARSLRHAACVGCDRIAALRPSARRPQFIRRAFEFNLETKIEFEPGVVNKFSTDPDKLKKAAPSYLEMYTHSCTHSCEHAACNIKSNEQHATGDNHSC